jgi:hypothetical protein
MDTASDVLWRMGEMGLKHLSVEKCQVHKKILKKERHERDLKIDNIRTVLREWHKVFLFFASQFLILFHVQGWTIL